MMTWRPCAPRSMTRSGASAAMRTSRRPARRSPPSMPRSPPSAANSGAWKAKSRTLPRASARRRSDSTAVPSATPKNSQTSSTNSNCSPPSGRSWKTSCWTVLSTLETADAHRKQAVRALAAHESRWESEQAQLRSEASRLAAALAAAEARRVTQQALLNPTTLRTYEEVRRRRGAVAVARVVGGACGGCRVAIPETVRRRAFNADQIAQCPNCERILYVG